MHGLELRHTTMQSTFKENLTLRHATMQSSFKENCTTLHGRKMHNPLSRRIAQLLIIVNCAVLELDVWAILETRKFTLPSSCVEHASNLIF